VEPQYALLERNQKDHVTQHEMHLTFSGLTQSSSVTYNRTNIIKHYYTNISANTTDTFKARLDTFWHNQDIVL